MPRNIKLEDDVRAILDLDPRISAPVDIAVAAESATVTLRGTVSTFKERHAALEDVKSLEGVDDVVDDMRASLLADPRDEEIRGALLQTLLRDSELSQTDIDVKVSNGWITLTGRVKQQSDSDAAFRAATGIPGAGGITNRITVSTE